MTSFLALFLLRNDSMLYMLYVSIKINRFSWQRVKVSLPVSKRRNEVQTAVDAVILDILPVQSTFIPEILLKLLLDVIRDGLPAYKWQEKEEI